MMSGQVLKARLEALAQAQAPAADGTAATPPAFTGVVAPLDGDAPSFAATLAGCGANWACLPPSQAGAETARALAARFGVRTTPCLVVLNAPAHTVRARAF